MNNNFFGSYLNEESDPSNREYNSNAQKTKRCKMANTQTPTSSQGSNTSESCPACTPEELMADFVDAVHETSGLSDFDKELAFIEDVLKQDTSIINDATITLSQLVEIENSNEEDKLLKAKYEKITKSGKKYSYLGPIIGTLGSLTTRSQSYCKTKGGRRRRTQRGGAGGFCDGEGFFARWSRRLLGMAALSFFVYYMMVYLGNYYYKVMSSEPKKKNFTNPFNPYDPRLEYEEYLAFYDKCKTGFGIAKIPTTNTPLGRTANLTQEWPHYKCGETMNKEFDEAYDEWSKLFVVELTTKINKIVALIGGGIGYIETYIKDKVAYEAMRATVLSYINSERGLGDLLTDEYIQSGIEKVTTVQGFILSYTGIKTIGDVPKFGKKLIILLKYPVKFMLMILKFTIKFADIIGKIACKGAASGGNFVYKASKTATGIVITVSDATLGELYKTLAENLKQGAALSFPEPQFSSKSADNTSISINIKERIDYLTNLKKSLEDTAPICTIDYLTKKIENHQKILQEMETHDQNKLGELYNREYLKKLELDEAYKIALGSSQELNRSSQELNHGGRRKSRSESKKPVRKLSTKRSGSVKKSSRRSRSVSKKPVRKTKVSGGSESKKSSEKNSEKSDKKKPMKRSVSKSRGGKKTVVKTAVKKSTVKKTPTKRSKSVTKKH